MSKEGRIFGIKSNVIYIGLTSFFTDTSTKIRALGRLHVTVLYAVP